MIILYPYIHLSNDKHIFLYIPIKLLDLCQIFLILFIITYQNINHNFNYPICFE